MAISDLYRKKGPKMQQGEDDPISLQRNSAEESATRNSRNLTIARVKRILVHSMSGFVITISVVLMMAMLGGMSKGNAEWDVIAFAGTGVGLLGLAFTVIWRTRTTRMAWWEVAEAAIQYAVSGCLLAWAALNHGFYGVSVAYSQAHLIISTLFCAWNLFWVYRAKTEPK